MFRIKIGYYTSCEIELNTPDDTFALADKHPLTINKESVMVGSRRGEVPEKGEPDYVAFTVSFPAELVILDHGFYDCGLSTTKTVLYDKDQKELWSMQEFPTTRAVTLQPGTYYLGLFFETQDYMLWFKDKRVTNPTKS